MAEAKTLLTGLGLFSQSYYLETYTDVAQANVDAFEHYFLHGYTEGRRPNPLFDSLYYAQTNPELADLGAQPLLHYAIEGDRDGRRPSPLFDPQWYRKRYELADGENALSHYLAHRNGPFSPIPEFDAEYYLKEYPDIAAAKIDPFIHFIEYGYKEGRNPSEEFDTRFYIQRYFKGKLDENPLLHYLAHRHQEGIYPKPPENETTIPAEVRRFTKPGRHFEETRPLGPAVRRRATVLAYYLTQFHAFEENDRWWGTGFTEWTNIARGMPRFQDHYQPRVPRDLGFYSLLDEDVMRKQVALAKGAGVNGFVFYYYWFNQHRLMERPLEAFLRNRDIDMPFCLMWANENWTRRWDGMESEVLIAQDYRDSDNVALIDDFARHFSDPRYIRIKGRPLLMIYRPGIIPNTAATIDKWRKLFKRRHNEDPILIMSQSFNDFDPRVMGMDAAIEFPPHKITAAIPRINDKVQLLDDTFSGNVYSYDTVVSWSLNEPDQPFPLIKTVVPSWDNDARRQGTGLVITGSTPAKYESWLSRLIDRANQRRFFGEAIVCVNAWNEWCEGAYLEPDLHFGSAYLNATARAVSGFTGLARAKLVLVGHDAFPSGAQHLLLSIGRVLKSHFGFEIEFLLLDGGAMEEEYRACATVSIASNNNELIERLASLRERGVTAALCNTSVTGKAAAALKAAGLRTVMLVHELPRILKEKQLEGSALAGITRADAVVFPNTFVQEKVLEALSLPATNSIHIRAQGMYKHIERDEAARLSLRSKLGLSSTDKLVLGVGYADIRKGFDLFYQTWRHLYESGNNIHFVWVGGMDPQLAEWMKLEMEDASATGTFHLAGHRKDVENYFSAADAFLLSSREDPFPTVALEAISAQVPVFAFAGTGGIPQFLLEREIGYVVPYCNVLAMAQSLLDVLSVEPDLAMIEAGREIVERDFYFPDYVKYLSSLLFPDLPSVSVVVPNYNYADCIADRLNTIFEQTHPVNEVVVLDDKSSDNSIDVIVETAESADRDITLIVNEANSGSVFKQWGMAVGVAQSEFLWIAEADDLADPALLSTVMPIMQADPSIVMAFVDSRSIDKEGNPVYDSYKGYYASIEPNALLKTEVFSGQEFVRRLLSVKNAILNVSAVIWRRDALQNALNNCFDELLTYKMAGDWRLYLELLSTENAKIAYIADPLNVHRRHAASVTHSLNARRHVEEIGRCHIFAARQFGLPKDVLAQQEAYRREVAKQLGDV